MGDGGALLLGLLMAASTIAVGGQPERALQRAGRTSSSPRCSSRSSSSACRSSTPLFAIIRRATRRSGVATADKEHLHHRLMRLGHGQRRAVLILWAWTAALSGFVLYPAYTGEGDAVVPLAVLVLGFGLYVFFHPGGTAAERRTETAATTAVADRPTGTSGRWCTDVSDGLVTPREFAVLRVRG